jgi:T5SS/PEP-CTERM-associated repeat protein
MHYPWQSHRVLATVATPSMERTVIRSLAAARRLTLSWFVFLAAFFLAGPLPPACATITPVDDVLPSDPPSLNWTSTTDGYIGNTSGGTLTVDGDSDLLSSIGYIGYGGTATGLVNVAGTGSTWTNSSELNIGYYGVGTLSITDRGVVKDTIGYIGRQADSSGSVSVSGSLSNWTNTGELNIGYDGSGTLSITNRGGVKDTIGYIGRQADSSGYVKVDGVSSIWTNTGSLNVGYYGSGTLSIANRGKVTNTAPSYIGYQTGATGLVEVSGSLSTWTNSTDLNVGYYGGGTLSIASSGNVSSDVCYIARQAGSIGEVSVAGASSTWTSGKLSVGYSGKGTLSITAGGSVSSAGADIARQTGSIGAVSVAGTNSAWRVYGELDVGYYGKGTLTIKDGGRVTSSENYVGYYSGSTGSVTVDGLGSTWGTNNIIVGGAGGGTLSIINGGSVNGGGSCVIGGSTSIATVAGRGSTLNCGLLAAANLGSGTISIIEGGSASSYAGFLASWPGSTGVIRVNGAGSTWTNGELSVASTWSGEDPGYRNGTLQISKGGSVTCGMVYIATFGECQGAISVDGAGSILNSDALWLGGRDGTHTPAGLIGGNATVSITNGGHVVSNGSNDSYIGYASSSTGLIIVDGPGSSWTNTNNLIIGRNGSGTVSITSGGSITAKNVQITNTSLLAVDVGSGTKLTVDSGTGTVTNNGVIRIFAGAGVPVDPAIKYAPIAAGSWSDTAGLYQAVGGTWDATAHEFTASSVIDGTSGLPVSMNLQSIQRALVSGSAVDGTNWVIGASFPAAANQTDITFSATVASDTILDDLETAVGDPQTILSAWTFSTTDYTLSPTNPIYFSLLVGENQSLHDFTLWQHSGSSWTKSTIADLTYDGTYASFTATSGTGFAITAVPEPSTLALTTMSLLAILFGIRRKRRQP